MDEPEFSVAYARMCEVLREKDVGDKSVNFRKLLIARCQKEFERDYMEGFDRAKFEAQLAATESEGERKKLQVDIIWILAHKLKVSKDVKISKTMVAICLHILAICLHFVSCLFTIWISR